MKSKVHNTFLPAIQTQRWYRGESGDMKHRKDVIVEKDDILKREEELLAIAVPKANAIQAKHTQHPNIDWIPQSSLPSDMTKDGKEDDPVSRSELELQVRRKRLVYRAKQRGWLEVDLLLGTWASKNVPSLDMDELNQFEDFVNLETIDIYNIITLRSDVPDIFKRENGDGVVEQIQEWARSSPLGKGEPEKYSQVKRENNLI